MKRTNISLITALLLGLAAGMTTGCFKGFESAKPSAEDLSPFNKPGAGDDTKIAEDPGGNDPSADTAGDDQSGADTTGAGDATQVPVDLKATQPSTPFIPADRAEGQAFSESATTANSASIITSNDEILAGAKNDEASKLIKALTIQVAGGTSGIELRIEAAVVAQVEDGTLANRLLTIDTSISQTPVKFIENGDVMPLQVNLQKDVQDATGVPAGNSIVAYAVCKDVACAVIQIRLDFQVPGGVISAIFVEQMAEGGAGYVLAASNISTDLNSLPSFKAHTDAQLAALTAPAPEAAPETTPEAANVETQVTEAPVTQTEETVVEEKPVQQEVQAVQQEQAQVAAPKMDPAVDAVNGPSTWDKLMAFAGLGTKPAAAPAPAAVVKSTPVLPQGTAAQEAAMDKLPAAKVTVKPTMQMVDTPAVAAVKSPSLNEQRAEQLQQRLLVQKAATARAAEAARIAAANVAAQKRFEMRDREDARIVALTAKTTVKPVQLPLWEQRAEQQAARLKAEADRKAAAETARIAAANAAAQRRFEIKDREEARIMGLTKVK